jgi:lysozyme
MAENVDPKEVAGLKAEVEALKKKKGRRVLTKAMKEREDFFNKGYEEGKKEAEAAGKGKFGQIRAGFKRANEREDEFQAATMGTKRNKEKFFKLFGIEMGDWARQNLEDKVSPEEQAAARSKLGLDKKEKKEKPSAKSTKAGLVGADKLMKEIVGIRNTVQSLAKFILVNRGFTSEIDPKTGKILYRNKKGQFAKAEEATFANFKNVSTKDKKAQTEKERGMALGSKINADEDPQIRIADTLEAILKTLGQGDVSIQERLDKIERQGGGGGGGLIDDLLDNTGGRNKKTRTRTRTPKGKLGKLVGGVRNVAGKIGGKGLGLLSKLGMGAAAAGAAATGVGAGLGATTAGAAAAGAAATGAAAAGTSAAGGAAALEKAAAKAAPAATKGASKVLATAKNVLKFLKKVPGLSLLASGAALIMQISNAIDAHEKGEINDAKLHSVIAGAVGGALGGVGGAELVGVLGASVGTMIFPGVGTFVGGLLGSTAGFFAGEGIGQAAGEKLWSFFEKNTEAPADAIKAAEKAKENLKPATPAAQEAKPAAVAPPKPAAPPAPGSADEISDTGGIQPMGPVSEPPAGAAPSTAPPAAAPPPPAPTPPTPPKPTTGGTGAPAGGGGGGGGDADVKDMIKRHEGVRFKPYKDSLGLWTIGVGHLIGDGKTLPPEYNREFSAAEVDAMFNKDFEHHQDAAEKIPGYDALNPKGQGALTDLTFNMGPSWYKKWPKFTKFLSSGDTEGAAQSLESSKWYGQVGRRAPEVVSMLRAGGGENGGGDKGKAGLPESKPSQSGTPTEPAGSTAPSGGAASGGMVASAAASPPSPAASPSVQPVQSTAGAEMAAQSNDYQNTQMVAQNQPPPAPVVVNNSSGGSAAPPAPKTPLPKAGTRSDDGSFMRALAKDFAHPTAFTSVSMV